VVDDIGAAVVDGQRGGHVDRRRRLHVIAGGVVGILRFWVDPVEGVAPHSH
jgi:hypothetical protein